MAWSAPKCIAAVAAAISAMSSRTARRRPAFAVHQWRRDELQTGGVIRRASCAFDLSLEARAKEPASGLEAIDGGDDGAKPCTRDGA